MRTIKFRAWDKEKKEMIFEGLEYWIRLLDVGSDWKKKSNPPIGFIKEHDYKRFIVQQFTGLTDKNGKEIYEGDLFKIKEFDKEFIYEICWDDENSGWVYRRNRLPKKEADWRTREDGKVYKAYQPEYLDIKTLEVIGNIYENPELLEK